MNAGVVEEVVVGPSDEVRRDTAAGVEGLVVDGRPVDRRVASACPLDLGDLEAAALGSLRDRLGLQHAGSKAAVRAVAKASPFLWNVLLVEPWTPGHAPVARLYQPAPVLGGACVSRPSCDARTPLRMNDRIVGISPWFAYFLTRS